MRLWLIIFTILVLPPSCYANDPVNTCHNNTGGGTATSIACSITPGASGHYFVVGMETFGPPASPNITITNTASSSWTLLSQPNTASPGHITSLQCAKVNSASAQTFTAADTLAATSMSIVVAEYANITSCTPDQTPVSSFAIATGPVAVSAGNLTTTGNDRLVSLIFTCTAGNTSVNTAGSGYTKEISDQLNATGIGGCVGTTELEDQFAASGTYAGAWTVNASTGANVGACGAGTGPVCWLASFAALPSTSGIVPKGFPMVVKNGEPHRTYKIPFDTRRRKLQIVSI